MPGSAPSILVKICGINSAAAADAVLRVRADFGGLVFHAKSPRNLGIVNAGALARQMRGKLKLVALVADASDDDLLVIANAIKPDLFQLHGKETPARAAAIRERFKTPIIKAIPVADEADLATVADYESVAEMLMFDAKPPKDAERGGGHGTAFDWKLLNGWVFRKPWFLAGGLDPENVGRAITVSGAKMVDVSSGVESAPGVKNESLIAGFAAAARAKVTA